MRVLQFITRMDLGGAQECCLEICRELARRGEPVTLLTGQGGELLEDAKQSDGVDVRIWKDWHHAVRPIQDLRCLWRLSRLLRRNTFDILHTHSSKAGLIGRLAARLSGSSVKVIHHVHGWSFNESMPSLQRRIYVALERLAARPGYLLLSCSRATERQGRAAGIGRDEDRRTLYWGVELQENLRRRARAALRRRFDLGRNDLLFLQLGNLKAQKDPITFAKAAVLAGKRLPRAHFWIAGDGPLREEAESIAHAGGLDGRFRVLGWRRDVADLLAAADCKVLTSRFEGLPFAIMRAMAAGLPVIASDVDGNPEAVQEGVTGRLIRSQDSAGFADAMIELGSQPALRQRMGVTARKECWKFSERRSLAELLRLYRDCVSGSERRPTRDRGRNYAAVYGV